MAQKRLESESSVYAKSFHRTPLRRSVKVSGVIAEAARLVKAKRPRRVICIFCAIRYSGGMKRKVLLPILIFVLSLLSSLAILVLWIVWSASEKTHILWLLQGIILAIPIIGGVITIFVYYTKSKRLDAERVKFISGVSHELLTPVASLRLYTETMQLHDNLTPEKRREFLALMASDCARLQAQVTSLLTVLRSERGKQEYRLEPADLGLAVGNFLAANPTLVDGALFSVTLEKGLLALVDLDAIGRCSRTS